MLLKSIPGVPGEDYPIYAEVPETAFACDGQVDGGKTHLTISCDGQMKVEHAKFDTDNSYGGQKPIHTL